MSAYYIISYDVIDREVYEKYAQEVADLLPTYGASVMLADDQGITLEGMENGVNAIVVFPSKESALDCYRSEAYNKIKPLRLRSVRNSRFVLVSDSI